MKKSEIKKFINKYPRKDWYYYYDFDGMSDLLKRHGYSIDVYRFNKYTKPLVIGTK